MHSRPFLMTGRCSPPPSSCGTQSTEGGILMPTPVPQFPQRNLFSSSTPQPTALQIIRRVAKRESALEISDEGQMAQASEAAEDDSESDARSTFKQRTSALQEQIQALSFTNLDDLSRANELLASVLSLKDDI